MKGITIIIKNKIIITINFISSTSFIIGEISFMMIRYDVTFLRLEIV